MMKNDISTGNSMKRKKSSMKRSRRPCETKKSVSFLPNALMYRSLHINDYKTEEIRNTWYDRSEIQRITSDCMKTISVAVSKDKVMDFSQCLRGLEYRLPDGYRKRATNKLCAMTAVLDEQDDQFELEKLDDNEIKRVYSIYSIPCHAEACRMGLQDEIEAMRVYNDSNLAISGVKNTKEHSTIDILSITMRMRQLSSAKKISRHAPRMCSHIGRAA